MPPEPRASLTPASISQALRKAAQLFEDYGAGVPRLTAEVLLSHCLGVEKPHLYGHPGQILSPKQSACFEEYVQQRLDGKPTQYITGTQEFYGISFRVDPDVLIPRPETELLVEEALAHTSETGQILDLGTGSGCIAVAIKSNAPRSRVIATDISGPALRVARRNAVEHGVQVDFVHGDLVDAFRRESLGMIVCNPPYVPLKDLPGLQHELRYEPGVALFGGQDGLEVYRRLIKSAASALKPEGRLLLELGYNGRSSVEALLSDADWHLPIVRTDLAGIDRVLAVRRRS